VQYLCGVYRVSQRRACRTAEIAESTLRCQSVREPRTALRLRIREIAQVRVRYGYRKILVLQKREGWKVGKKLVYRLYCEEGLTLRWKPRRRRCAATNGRQRTNPTAPNEVWSLDFVADQLADWRRFRALTVVDVFTRESLAIEVGQSLKGEDVMRVLSRIASQRAMPKTLFCDNGTEFTSQAMDLWAYHAGVRIDFSRPGKPTDNAYVESFKGTQRAECLHAQMRTGSVPSQKRKRSSRLGGGNTTRVVLTGRTGRGRPANSQAPKLPENHSQDDAEKGDRSITPRFCSCITEIGGPMEEWRWPEK